MTEPNPEWSRPPFEPGNEMALRHGGYSPRRVDPLALEILEQVRPTVTWWTPADMPAVLAWARCEAQVQIVTEWLEDHGGALVDQVDETGTVVEVGSVRSAAIFLQRLEASAARRRSELGLTPLSRARLGRDVASAQVDMAQLFARLAESEARETAQAEAELSIEEGDDDDE